MTRYALVIGISKYDKFTHLPKAATDAEAIKKEGEAIERTVERKFGFWTLNQNLKYDEMKIGYQS